MYHIIILKEIAGEIVSGISTMSFPNFASCDAVLQAILANDPKVIEGACLLAQSL